MEGEHWNQPFEDIDLENGWFIVYPTSKGIYEDEKVIRLDPQGAFGTGIHETTKDCLRFILGESFNEKSILDLGTGSGILSIAAGLKGAKNIVAIDVEPVTREIMYHCKLNDISPITVIETNLFADEAVINENYDWTFINIGANETIELIEKHQLLRKSNNFLISGIVDWNEETLHQLFIENAFRLYRRNQTNEWVTITYTK